MFVWWLDDFFGAAAGAKKSFAKQLKFIFYLVPMTRKHFTCPNCHENSRVITFAPDRVTLEREKGEEFSVNCIHCGQATIVHVNKVKATANHLMTYVVSAFCLLVFLFIFVSGLYMNIWILLSVTSLIGLPVIVRQAIENMATTFNSYKL